MIKWVNLDPHDKDCNFHVNDPIREIQMQNLHTNKEMTELLSHLDTIDLQSPIFRYDTCALWTGEVKEKGNHRQPHCPYLPVSRSVIRFIYEQVYCVRLFKPKDVLRHMCPLITGQFNSGLCCNPLHLTLGTPKENSRDILVHDLIRTWMSNPHQTDFCFQHNSGMVSSIVQHLLPDEIEHVKRLASIYNSSDPTLFCCCDVVSIPKKQKREVEIPTCMTNERGTKLDGGTKQDVETKLHDKKTSLDGKQNKSDVLHLTLPRNRQKLMEFKF
jgi:hypothetical protein